MTSLTIATRVSKLALWQANWVKAALTAQHPDIQINLLPISTRGDQIIDRSLAKIGGKGLFVKELETALLTGAADLAVHSMKDVPMTLPKGLTLASICQRGNPCDSLLSRQQYTLDTIPAGAIIGTSSLRRQSQLLSLRPDLTVSPLRGNIDTRIAHLLSGKLTAIILAQAGIDRLNLGQELAQPIPIATSLPAAGQGAIGIECRAADEKIIGLISTLHHTPTAACIRAERALVRQCEGNCQVPIAAYATIDAQTITLTGRIASADGTQSFEQTSTGTSNKPEQLGIHLAKQLISLGANTVLEQYR